LSAFGSARTVWLRGPRSYTGDTKGWWRRTRSHLTWPGEPSSGSRCAAVPGRGAGFLQAVTRYGTSDDVRVYPPVLLDVKHLDVRAGRNGHSTPSRRKNVNSPTAIRSRWTSLTGPTTTPCNFSPVTLMWRRRPLPAALPPCRPRRGDRAETGGPAVRRSRYAHLSSEHLRGEMAKTERGQTPWNQMLEPEWGSRDRMRRKW
jgi:hypothetical protein